jgi:hypothetical protein
LTSSDLDTAGDLAVAVDRLVRQVQHWTPARWARDDRGARVHRLLQALADAAADATGEVRRAVPRLDNDLAIPDQLRVLVRDAVQAGVHDQDLIDLVRDTSHAISST